MTDHTDAQRMAVERARERDVTGEPAECSSMNGRLADNRRSDSSDPDTLLRELVRSVAQATIGYAAEQDYDGPAEMYAERAQLAEEVARFTFACAAEEDDVALNLVRRALR